MSFIDRTKEFFGLQPVDIDSIDREDAYYAADRTHAATTVSESVAGSERISYASNGSAAYAPRHYGAESFEPTIVPVSLTSFKEAMKIGEPFVDGDAVVFELTDADKASSRRLIDFSAGLVVAGKGTMKNLTENLDTERLVFAILPPHCTIARAELERAAGLR